MKITPPVVILPLAATNGGTGQSSYAIGDLITANTTTTLARLADVAVGQVLASGGVGAIPAWSALTGTANQVIVSGLTLSLPQSIATTSTPTFGGLTLTGTLAMGANAITSTGQVNGGTFVGVTSATVPTVIGGTAVGSSLTLQSTSGVGTTDFIRFLVGNNGATEAMRVIDSGSVGIGVTGPLDTLHVATPSGGAIRVSGDNSRVRVINATSGLELYLQAIGASNGRVGTLTNHNLTLATNNTDRVTVDTAGSVGIGVASPLDTLHVVTAVDAGGLRVSGGGNTRVRVFNTSGMELNLQAIGATNGRVGTLTNHNFTFATNNTDRLTMDTAGNVGIGTTTPGAQLDLAGYSLTGAAATSMFRGTGTLNTSGVVDVWKLAVTETSSGSGSNLFALYGGAAGTTARFVVNASTGNVGIGRSNPAITFDVTGRGRFTGNGSNTLIVTGDAIDVSPGFTIDAGSGTGGRNYALFATVSGASAGAGKFAILDNTAGLYRTVWDAAGNVGIGTTSPSGLLTLAGPSNTSLLVGSGYSLTGASTLPMVSYAGTLNTSGVVDVWKLAITDTASGAGSNLIALYGGAAGATARFAVTNGGNVVLGSTTSLSLSGANNRVQVGPGTVPAKTGLAVNSVAAAAAEDGGVMLATTDNTLVYYASGNRYKVVGVAF